jgi:hypothetical protein
MVLLIVSNPFMA